MITMTVDIYTGKQIDRPSDNLSNGGIGEYCDECGTELIDKCARCGAPICCPECCAEDEEDSIIFPASGE